MLHLGWGCFCPEPTTEQPEVAAKPAPTEPVVSEPAAAEQPAPVVSEVAAVVDPGADMAIKVPQVLGSVDDDGHVEKNLACQAAVQQMTDLI